MPQLSEDLLTAMGYECPPSTQMLLGTQSRGLSRRKHKCFLVNQGQTKVHMLLYSFSESEQALSWKTVLDEIRRDDAKKRSDHELLFHSLVSQWQNDVAFVSSATDMILHPAYQRIIGMGKKALPLLLKELRDRPNHWFWALFAITGENPVKAENTGDLEAMTSDWLSWAEQKGYL